MIYFTSDLHFGHDRDFIYKVRGFDSIAEHDEALISNWNSIINDDDIVFVLGDIMLKDNDNGIKCWKRLKGQKKIIWGNHDSKPKRELLLECPNTEEIGCATFWEYNDRRYFLSHYPTLTANFDDAEADKKRVYNICGHTHTSDKFQDLDKGLIYHVEPECQDNYPVPIDKIISDFKSLKRK